MITSQSCESWKITIEIHTYKVVPNKSLAQLVVYAKYIYNVVKKIYKNPPFWDGLYHPFIHLWWI